MMRKCLVGVLMAILLILSFVNAQSIDTYELEFTIASGRVVTYHSISGTALQGVRVRLPEDASAMSLYRTGQRVEPIISENKLILPASNEISFNFITKDYIDKQSFVFNFIAPVDISSLKIMLTIPENSILKRPFEGGDLSTGSAYPSPDHALSDGRSIVLVWEKELAKGEELPIFVGYQQGRNYIPLIVLLVILIIGAVVFIVLRKPKTIVKKEDMLEEHLKEDEEQIVNVLKQRDGHKMEQGTLRVVTGFSKATLSRLLKELEDRQVVYKEKRGKKNLIFLKK